ncbi:hypothetical protein [Sporohalobacter salinus]|nr:hypothetical protein [Sporohalobacter salinus]MBM7624474.1 hypothetical protein [Sporohalobacter salinus]
MNDELDLQRESVFDVDMKTTLELIRRALAGEASDERKKRLYLILEKMN